MPQCISSHWYTEEFDEFVSCFSRMWSTALHCVLFSFHSIYLKTMTLCFAWCIVPMYSICDSSAYNVFFLEHGVFKIVFTGPSAARYSWYSRFSIPLMGKKIRVFYNKCLTSYYPLNYFHYWSLLLSPKCVSRGNLLSRRMFRICWSMFCFDSCLLNRVLRRNHFYFHFTDTLSNCCFIYVLLLNIPQQGLIS